MPMCLPRLLRRCGALGLATVLFVWSAWAGQGLAAPAPQQTAPVCFAETGYCTGGRIREVWERGGGLMVFGFPITAVQEELIEGQPRQVQWFERARVELHPDNQYPYDVLVGRVGADLMGRQARGAPVAATSLPGDCRLFAATGISLCGDFLAAWSAAGLDLDGVAGVSEAESLALYGLPLTPARTERLLDGQAYVVQWFERARFELHPQPNGGSLVLRGLLGRELAPVAADPPGTPWSDPFAPPPAALSPAQAPARLVISAIGLDAPTVPVGVDATGAFVVPDHEVGWYLHSAAPGQGENIVFWGHVLPFSHALHIPAPFARLKELPPGAALTIIDNLGQAHPYVVTQQLRVAPDEVGYVLAQGRELVTLVSCIGEGVYVGNEVVDYTQRLITIAEPAGVP